VIERHARPLGILVTDDAQGRLVLTRAGAERNAGGLALGANILFASAEFSQAERYTHYVVKGQGVGARAGGAPDLAGAVGAAGDPDVPDGRRLLIVSETQGDSRAMAARAAWEAATRAGRALQAQIATAGWRDGKGALWRTNALTRVKDAWLGIDRDLLVTAATFTLSDPGGSRVAMTLMPPEAFTPQPEVAAALGKGIEANRVREAQERRQ
jgi:prophage tail gpP-like protein